MPHTSMERNTLQRQFQSTADADLRKIIMHIQQDFAEKVDEVLVKAEEEFKQEKFKEIIQGLRNIDKMYEWKETKTKRETLVYESKMKNLSRIKILHMKYEHVEDVLEKARVRLSNKDMSTHSTPYKGVLKALIMQGLCKLLEPRVIVTARKSDVVLVRSLLGESKQTYERVTVHPISLNMNEGKYLHLESEGGVLLSSPDGTVTLDNTLSSRLDMIGFYLLPEINRCLFGEKKEVIIQKRPSYLPTIEELSKPIELQRKDAISIERMSITSREVEEYELNK